MKILTTIKSFLNKFNFKKNKEEARLKIAADLKISDVNVGQEGINFKANYRGSSVPFWLAGDNEVSDEQAGLKVQAAAVIITNHLARGLNLVEISQIMRKGVDKNEKTV
jgi:hypothetical protein